MRLKKSHTSVKIAPPTTNAMLVQEALGHHLCVSFSYFWLIKRQPEIKKGTKKFAVVIVAK